MDLGYMFVVKAFFIQLVWAVLVLLLEKGVFSKLGQGKGRSEQQMGETFLMMLLELIIAAVVVIGAIGIKKEKDRDNGKKQG